MTVTLPTTSPLPVTGQDIASAPNEDRKSAKRMARFIWDQYDSSRSLRRQHGVSWVMVQSFLRGIHYFTIDGLGSWRPIRKEPGTIREVVPILKPMMRHVLGFLNANELGISTIPVAGSAQSTYRADRAEAIINGWIRDSRFHEFFDRANQILLAEGLVGYHRFIDPFRQNVFVRALPASEMFPIPFDARDPSELHGLGHASFVSKQWLEIQDDLAKQQAQQAGMPAPKSLAQKSKGRSTTMHVDLPFMTSGGKHGKFDGALQITAWMKGNERTPGGEYIFMLEDEIFRYAGGSSVDDPITRSILPGGNIPVEFVYYDKNPNDFYGMGLGEALVPAQFSADRNATLMSRNAKLNRPMVFYDNKMIESKAMAMEDDGMIPFDGTALESSVRRLPPIFQFPAQQVGRDVLGMLELSQRYADNAAGFRSGIAFGQAEGRVESGPATSLLSQNAMSSLTPVFKRMFEALRNTYEGVLDMLKFAWPKTKMIRVVGPSNIGRELTIQRSELPASTEVIIQPRPLLPGGRQTLASILFQLKQMPGQDGKPGSELSSQEFRRSLSELNLMPPGIELQNKPEARIQTRINLLIGDGRKPAIAPSNIENDGDRLIFEDHQMSLKMLRDVILDDSYLTYSKPVQQGLIMQLEFHRTKAFAGVPSANQFDDDIEKLESAQTERFIAAAENDFDTDEGEFQSALFG